MTPLFVVTKAMPHHRGHAGYNQLLAHVDPDTVVFSRGDRVARLMGGITRRMWQPLTRVAWYGAPSALAEVTLAAKIVRSPPGVIHVMYGEDLLFLLPRLGRRHRIVATFHQPRERFDKLVRSRIWQLLDGVIVLDESNATAWSERVGAERVFRSTLGIDGRFWHPGAEDQRDRRCLVVGNHLRDFDTLERVVGATPEVDFDLVIAKTHQSRFARLANVSCHTEITDERLAEMFRRAALLVLPLTGGSASNTLLQALASGLPIVTTEFAGASTYVDDTCAIAVPRGDHRALANQIRTLLDDPERTASMRRSARLRSERFEWSSVAARHREIYDAVMDTR